MNPAYQNGCEIGFLLKARIDVIVCVVYVSIIIAYTCIHGYRPLCSEVNAGFFYKSAEEREKLVQAERAFTDEKVQKVIELKRKVCEGNDRGFVVINQKVCCICGCQS